MTSFSVGIISSMRMSGGKPRSSKAGSAKAPASDEEQKNAGVRMYGGSWPSTCILRHKLDIWVVGALCFHTLRALAECVGLHAKGSAEAFPVTEAGRFGLLRGTLLDGLGVTC